MVTSTSKPSDTFGEQIMSAVKDAIRKNAEEIFERQKEMMIERLQESKDEIIARLMLKISEHLSYQDLGRTIRIEVSKDLK